MSSQVSETEQRSSARRSLRGDRRSFIALVGTVVVAHVIVWAAYQTLTGEIDELWQEVGSPEAERILRERCGTAYTVYLAVQSYAFSSWRWGLLALGVLASSIQFLLPRRWARCFNGASILFMLLGFCGALGAMFVVVANFPWSG